MTVDQPPATPRKRRSNRLKYVPQLNNPKAPAIVTQLWAKPIELVPTTHQRARITEVDVENMAQLAANGLTEAEACMYLNIKYKQWADWKSKNRQASYFKECFVRVKAAKINGMIEHIRAVGLAKDWRALAWILERTESERFADKRGDINVNIKPKLEVSVISEALKQVYGQPKQAQGQVTDRKPAGQLLQQGDCGVSVQPDKPVIEV